MKSSIDITDTAMTPFRILIAGGGIGGLVCALQLHRLGLAVEVFEASKEMRALGVGINLLPHAVRVLRDLGLDAAMAETAIETGEWAFFNRHGQSVWREARGRAAGYAVPQYSIHRGELQMILYRAFCDRIGAEHLHLGARVEAVEQNAQQVQLHFANNSHPAVTGAALIAADGIHSVVRRRFYPDEGEPRFAGRMMWRGVTETKPVLSGRSMVWVGNDAQKFISYPISETLRQQGRARLNWVAAVQVPLDQTPPRSDWNREVDRALFTQRYANWRFPWLDVPDIIRRAPAVFEFPMVDRDPLPAWTRGRVTLLGDAAHPMWPIGSNGASQAILDTEALAQQLAPHVAQAPGLTQALPNALPAALPAALLAYEALRRPATAAVVLANRRGGPDQVLQLAEERAPDGFDDIEQVIPLTEREAIAARYKQTAGFDKSLVNQQAQSQQQQ